jgi:hypothetical protein
MRILSGKPDKKADGSRQLAMAEFNSRSKGIGAAKISARTFWESALCAGVRHQLFSDGQSTTKSATVPGSCFWSE